jgi:hypothetical protein
MSPNAEGEGGSSCVVCTKCTWSPKKLRNFGDLTPDLTYVLSTERKLAKYWWSYTSFDRLPWTQGWQGQECWRRIRPPPPRLGWIRSAALCLTPTPRYPDVTESRANQVFCSCFTICKSRRARARVFAIFWDYFCNLSFIIYLPRVLCLSYSCLSSCHSCGTVSYSLCLSNQSDQGDEREGFEREGLEMER